MAIKFKGLKSLLPFLFILVGFYSCNVIKKNSDPAKKPVARAFDAYLYLADIQGIVPKGTKVADSMKILNEYLTRWMQQEVIVHQALNNLDPKQIDFTRQIEDYKNSLIIYEYEKELVKENLDTTIAEQEINDYYEQNKKDFQLKNDIVKIIYVKVPKKVSGQEKLKGWMNSNDIKDREKLATFCNQNASNYFLDDNAWLMFDDVLKEVPIETANQDIFLQNNNNHIVQIADSVNAYYLGIKGFMVKNSISPLSFEKENIKKILLNKRKMDLVEKMKLNSFEQAQGHNDVELYK
ncbi:MAG TPA: hypothetical protein VK808_05620 [Bacteroidia bacterium]|jgi:hypothetical protein|nr:hypothetical protein [Bacteroidia bacterium]